MTPTKVPATDSVIEWLLSFNLLHMITGIIKNDTNPMGEKEYENSVTANDTVPQ